VVAPLAHPLNRLLAKSGMLVTGSQVIQQKD
jgi:hypothetical protein